MLPALRFKLEERLRESYFDAVRSEAEAGSAGGDERVDIKEETDSFRCKGWPCGSPTDKYVDEDDDRPCTSDPDVDVNLRDDTDPLGFKNGEGDETERLDVGERDATVVVRLLCGKVEVEGLLGLDLDKESLEEEADRLLLWETDLPLYKGDIGVEGQFVLTGASQRGGRASGRSLYTLVMVDRSRSLNASITCLPSFSKTAMA